MNFLKFLKNETSKPLHKIILMAAVSGISNAALLAVINSATKNVSEEKLNFRYLLMFLISMALFIVAQKYILGESTRLIEEILSKIRLRLSDKIRKADLLSLETIGNTPIYNRLTQETVVISTSGPTLIFSVQSMVMLFFVSIYVATLSMMAFILILIVMVTGIGYYLYNHKILATKMEQSNLSEMSFFESLTDLLEGMKEAKLNNERSDGLYNHIDKVTWKLKILKTDTGIRYFNNAIFANSFYYMLIGVLVFVLPRLYPTYGDVLSQLTAAVLFMIGPVGVVVGALQIFDQVNFAVTRIYKLEDQLESLSEKFERVPGNLGQPKPTSFKTIKLRDLKFSYNNESKNGAFTIGPFNFDIHAGETLFLVGGNGSGKTTFLKLLSMLYYPDQGTINLDGNFISPMDAHHYRGLFSAIFSDFHLFSKLYGLETVKREKVDQLLKTMDIDHKINFHEGRFSTLDLSTGQRKRLAMVVALLENKPIYIFDEWAADQDPEFRNYYYNVLIKKLKAEGKTIIAASHDDRYFHLADRVIKLDYGKIVEDTGNATKGD
jgi:cyclic peptide transporter